MEYLKVFNKYLKNNISLLTRFKKSNITLININELESKENEFEDIKIIVSSIRLDNFVSELARCSRSKADEIIESGRVFINSINELKTSKKLNEKDIITIKKISKNTVFL